MFQAGQQIGLYTLIKKLDKGGFGEVWLAEKQSEFVTKKFAIKLPLDEQVDFDAIRQEATLWEQASGYPNVLPLIDAGVYNGQVAIISEYAEYFQRKKFDRAIDAYTKVIELNSSDFTFYNNRGLAFHKKRRYDAAIADFDKAIELSSDAGVYNNRGVAYEDKGETAQAIADYRKALELDPNYKTANNNLNKILR